MNKNQRSEYKNKDNGMKIRPNYSLEIRQLGGKVKSTFFKRLGVIKGICVPGQNLCPTLYISKWFGTRLDVKNAHCELR